MLKSIFKKRVKSCRFIFKKEIDGESFYLVSAKHLDSLNKTHWTKDIFKAYSTEDFITIKNTYNMSQWTYEFIQKEQDRYKWIQDIEIIEVVFKAKFVE